MTKESIDVLVLGLTCCTLIPLVMTNLSAYLTVTNLIKHRGFEEVMKDKHKVQDSFSKGQMIATKIFYGAGDYFAERRYRNP